MNILGGLSSIQDNKAISGDPGLVDIPVLGKVLFGSDWSKENGQFLIALIPHIIAHRSTPRKTCAPSMSATTRPSNCVTWRPEDAAAPAPNPLRLDHLLRYLRIRRRLLLVLLPRSLRAFRRRASRAFQILPLPRRDSGRALRHQARAAASIAFNPGAVQSQAGNPLTVNLLIENASDLFSASPLHIKYDPQQLRLNDMTAGDVFSRDGQRAVSQKDIRNDSGDATLTVTRLPGTAGVSGSGTVVTLSFIAVGRGTSTIKVTDAGLKNSQQQAITITNPEINVRLQ